jgi:hypothetical protein
VTTHPLVVCLAGAGSQTGRALEVFANVIRYLAVAGGYVREDFVEASYRVATDGQPLAYGPEDSTAPMVAAVEAVRRSLVWLLRRHGRWLHLLGWSFGGAALFDAVASLLADEPSWARGIGSFVTFSSPLLGCDVDGIDLIGTTAAGAIGADLCRRGSDEEEKQRVRRDAARIRASGIRLVTLAAEEDAVVTPEDSLLPAPGPEPLAFILRPRARPGSPYLESVLGHGALPNDPTCWRRVLDALGPAEAGGGCY